MMYLYLLTSEISLITRYSQNNEALPSESRYKPDIKILYEYRATQELDLCIFEVKNKSGTLYDNSSYIKIHL
jgi:hypothetical protein